MPPPRQLHDPFTTNPPSVAAASLRNRVSRTSLRSNASAAPSRTRQPANLPASTRSRRPLSRATPRIEDGLLAASASERDTMAPRQPKPQQRGFRHGPPERRHARLRPARQHIEDQDIVIRQSDGSYLLGASLLGTPSVLPMYGGQGHQDAEANPDALEAYYAATARKYFTSGAHMGVRQSRHAEDEYERDRADMMANLRQQVMRQLENERWLYEPGDGLPAPPML